MSMTLRELAHLVDGQLHGDGDIVITGAATISDAEQGDITFAESPELARELAQCTASAVLVPPAFQPEGHCTITVEDVQGAFTKVVAHFRPPRTHQRRGVSAAAYIHSTARIGPNVHIHHAVTIGADVEIGASTTIHAGCHIMDGCRLGQNVVLFPNVVLYENTTIGSRCIIHAGAVLGAYGFGYNLVEGCHQRSSQLGYVEVADDVEIGACTTIDRGTYGATRIGQGTKIDNQVMIAHNCRIGRHNIICSQVGIAGSCTTGDYVVMAGQVGVRDHVQIGDGATLGAKAGVPNHVPAGAHYLGIPATPAREQRHLWASINRLPALRKEFRNLQRRIEELERIQQNSDQQDAA